MNWISVKDRLPEVGNFVLIYDSNFIQTGFLISSLDKKFVMHPFPRYKKQKIRNMNKFLVFPSHWMPLPEPPSHAE
jgi:hypothetical protein